MNAALIVLLAAQLQMPSDDPAMPLPPVTPLVPETVEILRPTAETPACTASPSRCLREALAGAHRALLENDRPAFEREFAAAKRLAANVPAPDGDAARRSLALLDDARRLWNAEFESPFFGEDSPLFDTMSGYPGWRDAVRRAVLVDDVNRRFYPTRESRLFLARLAGGDGVRTARGSRVRLGKR